MRHFNLEEWADFTRGVVDPERGKAMQAHLDSRCPACSNTLNLWNRLYGFGRSESAFNPPADAVEAAKGMLALHRPPEPRVKRAVPATLLFDSFRQPQFAGVRSAESAVRQLLYGAGEFQVDIRIEPQTDSEKVALVGQVLNTNDPDQGFGDVPVVLFRSGKPRAEAITNRFGEFRLEFHLESGLYIRVSPPGGPDLRIPVLEPNLSDKELDSELIDSKPVSERLRKSKKGTRRLN